MNWVGIFVLCVIANANGRIFKLSINPNRNEITDSKIEAEKQRLSNVDWSSYNFREPNGPRTYAFGYDNVFDQNGNEQFRSEEKLANGTVVGEYGYTDVENNRLVRVSYTSDHRGYRAKTQITQL